jgi:hypothetical protein
MSSGRLNGRAAWSGEDIRQWVVKNKSAMHRRWFMLPHHRFRGPHSWRSALRCGLARMMNGDNEIETQFRMVTGSCTGFTVFIHSAQNPCMFVA